MCRWMGSPFHDWIDYNGVTFSIDGIVYFRDLRGKNIMASRDFGY